MKACWFQAISKSLGKIVCKGWSPILGLSKIEYFFSLQEKKINHIYKEYLQKMMPFQNEDMTTEILLMICKA